jgi:muconolactone D-isomerase
MTMDFLVHIELIVPPGTDAEYLAELRHREAARAGELATTGNLVRLWRSSGVWGNWGLWRCGSRDALVHLLDGLPLRPFMSIEIHDLGPHPSDPAMQAEVTEDRPHG